MTLLIRKYAALAALAALAAMDGRLMSHAVANGSGGNGPRWKRSAKQRNKQPAKARANGRR